MSNQHKRGSVWRVIFGSLGSKTVKRQVVGTEIAKTRPAVIVSNNASNRVRKQVQVVPCSSKATDRIQDFQAPVRIDGSRSKALADQLTTVSKKRLTKRLGRLSDAEMRGVERAIKTQLGF